jgi:AraC-like DNA-binding protein
MPAPREGNFHSSGTFQTQLALPRVNAANQEYKERNLQSTKSPTGVLSMSMIYHIPSPPLNSYINSVYYRDVPMPCPRAKILPNPSLNLEINFGGAFHVYEANQTEPFAVCAESWWAGPRSAYYIIEWPLDIQIFIVDFKPGGAYPFLQLPLSELYNQVVSLEAIWGHFAAEIRERLYAAPTTQARFALLERLLLARLREAPHGLTAVQYAVAEIARHHGALSMKALSEHMGISQKHLIAQFKRLVGGTPKELARLYRFQHVLHSIDPTQPVDWALVAQQTRYYDQSHFTNDFKAFTGHSPTDYLQLRRRVHAKNSEDATCLLQLPNG